jgi:hypothetical protein
MKIITSLLAVAVLLGGINIAAAKPFPQIRRRPQRAGCLQAAGPPDSTATQSNARAPCALAFVPRGGRGDRNSAERCADSSARRPRLGSRRQAQMSAFGTLRRKLRR